MDNLMYYQSFAEAIQAMFRETKNIAFDCEGYLILKPMPQKKQTAYQKAHLEGYNLQCRHFCWLDNVKSCDVDMPLDFCSKNCAYATNSPGSNRVNQKGVVTRVASGRKGYVYRR